MFLQEQNRKKWILPITIGYFFTFIGFGFIGSALGPIINRLAESTGTGVAQLSYLYLFRSLGFIGSSLILSRLFDRFPGNRLIGLGVLLLGGSLALLGNTVLLWQLFAVMFFIGIAANIIDMGCNTLMQWLYRDEAGPYMNMVHVFYSIGSITTPFLIGRSLESGGSIGRSLIVLGALLVPVSIYVFFLPSPRIPSDGSAALENQNGAGHRSFWTFMIFAGLFILFMVGTECTFTSWLPGFLFMGGLTDEATAAYFTSIFWVGCLIGRSLSVWVSTKMKPHRFMQILLLITLIASFGFVFFQKNIRLIMLTILIVGASSGSMFPNMLLMIKEKIAMSARVNGIVFAFSEVGSMVVPWLIGQLFDLRGAQVFPAAVLVQISAALLFFVILHRKYPRRLEETSAEAI